MLYIQSIGSDIGTCMWRTFLANFTFNYNFIMTNFLKQVLLRFINSYRLGRLVFISLVLYTNHLFGRLTNSRVFSRLLPRLGRLCLRIFMFLLLYLYVKQIYSTGFIDVFRSIMLYVALNPFKESESKEHLGFFALDFGTHKENLLQKPYIAGVHNYKIYISFVRNFLYVHEAAAMVYNLGKNGVTHLSVTDPSAVSAEIEPEFLGGKSFLTPLVPQDTGDKFLLFFVRPLSGFTVEELVRLICLVLKYNADFLPKSDKLLISISTPFKAQCAENDVKSGRIKGLHWVYNDFARISSWTSTDSIEQVANTLFVKNIIQRLDSLGQGLFFIVRVTNSNPNYGKPNVNTRILQPRINRLSNLLSKFKIPPIKHQRSFHTSSALYREGMKSPFDPELLEKPVAKAKTDNSAPLPVLKTIDEGKTFKMHLSNPQLLSGEQLSRQLFNSVVNDPNFKQYGQHKVITVTVAFNPDDIHAGKVTGQYWGYHKYVPITNNTTFEEYWDQVKDNVTSKYIDNLYDDQVPKFLSVRVKNLDRFANTTINKTKDKKGKITFKVLPKSPVSIQKRSFHSTPLFNKSYQKHIIPLKFKNTVTPNSFSTLDIETISIHNTEVPIAISLVLVDFKPSSANAEPDKYFFTIDKSRLRYNGEEVVMETLDTEVGRMWLRLHKTLTKRASVRRQGCEAVKYIFVHNLGAFVRRQGILYLNILTNSLRKSISTQLSINKINLSQ